MRKTTKASLILLLVTAAWGFTFPLIKDANGFITPSQFVTIRFAIGAIILLPFVIRSFRDSSWWILLFGLALGLINSVIYVTQVAGLKTISSGQAAFIIGLNVLFVPFLNWLFKLGKLHKRDIAVAMAYLLGLMIFTKFTFQNVAGNWWCVLSAFNIALSIVILQFATAKKHISAQLFTFYQILLTVPVPLLFSLHGNYHDIFTPKVVIALLFCAIFATSIALFLQAKYQHFISATRAAFIYSLEPVFACVLAWILNGEALTGVMMLGGMVMLGSLLVQVLLEK